jgi:hypothetical protein
MRLIDLPGMPGFLETSPVGGDALWRREVGQVTDETIQLYYACAHLKGYRAAAVEAIDRVQSAAIMFAFENPSATTQLQSIVLHTPPEDPYFVDEFVDSLVKLRPARRRACLFALETQVDADDMVTLSFEAAKGMHQLPPLCQEILALQGKTRHFRLPYVFWEWATEQIATPLIRLGWSIEVAFECSWPQLSRRYREMVWINRSSEATSLLKLVEEAGR